MIKYSLTLVSCLLLFGCQPTTPTPATPNSPILTMTDDTAHSKGHDLQALALALSQTDDTPEPDIKPIITKDGRIKIDWSLIDTKQPKANLDTYSYPIGLDTQAVKNYANAYHISPKQAQHSMVVAMAAPEALGKLLDQLQGNYLSHHLTDGATMSLVITTKDSVVAETHEYVFADTFGKGLVLPIIITPQSNTPQNQTN